MRYFLPFLLAVSATAAGAAEPPTPAAAPAVREAYSVARTPVGTLIDDPAAKVVLDKYIPGMTQNPQIEMARGFTLKDIQQFAADQMTDEVLAKIETDFKALADPK